jgi:hypothetical protein
MQRLPTGTQIEIAVRTGVERLARRFRRNMDGTLKRSSGLSLESLLLLVVSAVCLLSGVHRVAGGGEASLGEAIAEIDRLGGRSTIDEEELKVVLDSTQATDASLERLKALTHLQKLEIWNTQVTDVGLEHLTGLPELRALYLARTLVTDAASVHLKRMPRLRTLDVSETKVTEAGVTELKKALPKLGIANLRGTEERPKAPQPSVEPISVPAGQKQQDSDNKTERAVTDALDWLARHQSADGRWTLDKYATACTDETCSGPGMQNADTAATALGLLPFLAAGQTHKSNGPHRRAVMRGLAWLMQNQKPDGDLRGGANMYAHGLATIAVCEAYGLTGDRAVGSAAQAAINFLEAAQNQATGGWRYVPGEAGDTSVLGWQLQALHSGRMAGLKVAPAALEGADKWIKSVALGKRGGLSQYTPEVSSPTPTMTAVALLSRQFLGSKPTEPAVVEGRQYLMANLPGRSGRNAYYWFYGTQAFKHVGGPDWDAWKRSVSQKLLESQCHDGCAAGSWSARKPVQDAWGQQGGRVMVTSLSALTLQVESGNLLLFKLDSKLARKAESK